MTAPLRLGPVVVDPPVVLAPMAGVTDAPFRVLCASFGAGLFVNQMVTTRALVEGHRASWDLVRFDDRERVRSLQLYGTDPTHVGEAVRRLVGAGLVDHIDMNFGCPAPKVTRNGGGAALPVRRRLLRHIIAAAIRAAAAESGPPAAGGVPVTVKFRLGIDDEHLTFLDTGRIAEEEGAAAVALHARTALDHYGPPARWDRIAQLRHHVTTIPVLGNGDIRRGGDAVAMMAASGCDGVVVGRGCLGRPWLFADLAAALAGRPAAPPPRLGQVADVVRRHVALELEWYGDAHRFEGFRKHLAWYLKGYPVGGELRAAASQVRSAGDIEELLTRLDPTAEPVAGHEDIHRSHSSPLRRVALPEGWLDDPDDLTVAPGADALVSGG